MREDGDLRSFAQTLGSAALGIGLGLGILLAGFTISRVALPEGSIVASSRSAAPPTATPAASPPPSTPPTSAPSAAPSAAPTRSPSPTPDPLVVTAYEGQGLRLAALAIPAGYTVTSPIAGTVRIVLYQFLEGSIREDANVATEPTYPYVFVTSADREVKLRPGAVERDVTLLVKNGDTVAAGAPLFRTVTTGPSSWRTFYDANVTAQVMASAIDRSKDEAIDPVPLFKK